MENGLKNVSFLHLNKNLKNDLFASISLEIRHKLSKNICHLPTLKAVDEFVSSEYFNDKIVKSVFSFDSNIISARKLDFLFDQFQNFPNLRSLMINLSKNMLLYSGITFFVVSIFYICIDFIIIPCHPLKNCVAMFRHYCSLFLRPTWRIRTSSA